MAASCRLLSGQLLGRIARGDAMRCHALAVENLRSSVAVARSRNFTALPNPRLLHRSSSSSLTSFHFESRPSAPLSHRSLGSHHHPLPALRRGFKSATPARQGSVAATHAQSIAESSSGSKADASDDLPLLTHPSVSTHLFLISGLVFAIVVVGGLTRLTESGLSITEWNLVTGTLPPLNQEQWMSEYNKYMVSPEGTLLNKDMTLSEFKRIYAWEWGHRLLGRVIGVAFLAPIPYFIYKRRLSPKSGAVMFTIATLIGGQGALGWYMVKSGLTHEAIQARDGVPRVSQYRLAAHLGMAFLVYSLALRHGITIRRDWALAKLGKGVAGASSVQQSLHLLQTPEAKRLRLLANGLTALVFTTAISGAFVAGLDAGLLYNTFPYMGEDLVPPISELYSHKYSRSPDGSDLYIRNSLENPTTVQFDHRVLATTTFSAIVALFLYVRRPAMMLNIPSRTFRWIKSTMHMAFLQVALGISTLVYLVPVPLAAAHQAGSLVLLSLCVAAGASLKMPSAAARRYISLLSKPTRPITGGFMTGGAKATPLPHAAGTSVPGAATEHAVLAAKGPLVGA